MIRVRDVALLGALVCVAASTHSLRAQQEGTEVVAQLYRDFAWETIIEMPMLGARTLVEQPRDVLARYFDDTLVSLILADQACVAQSQAICQLNFSPIWASQDPAAVVTDGVHLMA